MTFSGSNGSEAGGIKKDRLGSRKNSMTSFTCCSVPGPAISVSVANFRGRLIPRASVPRSVSALKIFSQIFFFSGVPN